MNSLINYIFLICVCYSGMGQMLARADSQVEQQFVFVVRCWDQSLVTKEWSPETKLGDIILWDGGSDSKQEFHLWRNGMWVTIYGKDLEKHQGTKLLPGEFVAVGALDDKTRNAIEHIPEVHAFMTKTPPASPPGLLEQQATAHAKQSVALSEQKGPSNRLLRLALVVAGLGGLFWMLRKR